MSKKIYPDAIIKRIMEKYGVGKRYITMSLTGDRKGDVSTSIRRDYNKMLTEYKRKQKELEESLKSI